MKEFDKDVQIVEKKLTYTQNRFLMVSVLMPVYNGEKYLREAIDSVLNQTYKDFEFLIIYDGSTDGSLAIIESYNDPRIRLINNPENIKLIATLNIGLKESIGKYIVRMDSDDVCFPNRIEEQIKFMDANPEIGISGSYWKRSIDKDAYRPPVEHEDIRIHLLKGSPILHPSSIFRKEFFDQHNLTYHSDFIHAEDYELWLRASKLFKLANYPKELLMYRTHPKQITREFSKVQEQISIKILNSQLKELGVDYDQSKITIINRFFNKSVYENDELKVILEFIEIVLSANKKAKLYDQERLKKFFKKNLNIIWNRCTMYNYDTFYQFNKSIVTGISDISLNLYVKMLKRVLF